MQKWFIEFPTFQYKEDVKELARKNGLKIVDAKFQGKEKQCENAPKLTLIEESKVKHPTARDLLIAEAMELGLEFQNNIKNKDLEILINDFKESK